MTMHNYYVCFCINTRFYENMDKPCKIFLIAVLKLMGMNTHNYIIRKIISILYLQSFATILCKIT